MDVDLRMISPSFRFFFFFFLFHSISFLPLPPSPSGTDRLTYKIVGGVFDFYYFFGPSPSQVTQQYTNVSAPFIILCLPFWFFSVLLLTPCLRLS
jgi:hypothetical protein